MLRNKDKELAVKLKVVDKDAPVLIDSACEEYAKESEVERENNNLKEVILQLSKHLADSWKYIEHLKMNLEEQEDQASFLRNRVYSLEEDMRVLEGIIDKVKE